MSNSLYDVPLNVLVVENDRNGCRFLTEVLTRFGCNVVAACDPEEAKKLSAECSPIDLLLTLNAMHLPEIDVVRFQCLQGEMQLVLRLLLRTLRAFRGDEDLLADVR